MNSIPFETLEQIFLNVIEYTHPSTERFPVLTPASKRGVLSARAVWGNYRNFKPLRPLFVQVLEATPFTVSAAGDGRGMISGLDAFSRSEYAHDITTLSFCPMVFRISSTASTFIKTIQGVD